jgi:uncharacterized sulfatase
MSFRNEHAAAVLWRYHNRPTEELYDIVADPQEQHNLAGDPRHARVREELQTRTAEWRHQQGDTETGPEDLNNPDRRVGVSPYIF